MPASTDISTDLDDITFLGRLSEALSDRIEEQTRPLFDEAGITVPVRCRAWSRFTDDGCMPFAPPEQTPLTVGVLGRTRRDCAPT